METTLAAQPDWVAHRASVLPSHIALADGARRFTYGELDAWADGVASMLAKCGVARGDRVALLGINSAEFAAAVHGVSRAGAILVPLNARLTPAEQAWQLQHCGARVVLYHGESEAAAKAAAAEADIRVVAIPGPGHESFLDGVRVHSPGDIHSIIYTSGTTGRPKGAMLTYANYFASAAASAYNIGVDANDRWLACMPLFHVGGLSILLRSAIYGTTAVIHPGFDETAVNRALREDGITLLSVVPAMLRRMLDADTEPYPSTVRAVLVGGGPVPRELLERALGRGLPVLQTYGLSECASQVSTLAPADAASHVGSAGKPLLTTRIRIDATTGEPGEILVAGPTVMAGYYNDPAATERALHDGWLHTGDVGRIDDEGFLYVVDRRDDLIISGGENVYPAEVEGHLLEHPAIEAAAVVGLAEEQWGHVVTAAVVTCAEFDPLAVEQWLRERLAAYKVPRRFAVVDSLPATASGKVQRHLVRQRLEREPAIHTAEGSALRDRSDPIT